MSTIDEIDAVAAIDELYELDELDDELERLRRQNAALDADCRKRQFVLDLITDEEVELAVEAQQKKQKP